MGLSKKAIKDFKKVYMEEFGEEITYEKAHEKFLSLVNLLRVILIVPPKKDQDE